MDDIDEGDIEYLDEDEDIVQQCVQTDPQTEAAPLQKPIPILVERPQLERKRKAPKTPVKKKDEDDSDYEPDDELMAPSPPPSPDQRRKKKPTPAAGKNFRPYQKIFPTQVLKTPIPILNVTKLTNTVKTGRMRQVTHKELVQDRKKLNIRIPDYDDPLCLPVRAIKLQATDYKRLSNWNSVCLEHFKHCDNLLKPEKGETRSSIRSLVFRNVVNKQSGRNETTIWSKTCVINKDGDKKSEIFQCVLPRYKGRNMLPAFGLLQKKQKPFKYVNEVILSKEEMKDGEVLVAYKPKEATSSVYKLIAGFDRETGQKIIKDDEEEDDVKMYAKEVAHMKMCAPCYQTSWRTITKNKKHPACPVCGRTYSTVYNLMAHFKAHSSDDISRNKIKISKLLADLLQCHYKCRVCQEKFDGIKALKLHLMTHQGKQTFLCDVGNHLAK